MVSREIITPPPYREILHREIAAIRVYPTSKATAKAAAEVVAGIVKGNPQARITYATGNTMIPVYAYLEELSRVGLADFKKTTAFHLDEYLPASPDEAWGFVNFLRKRVFGPLKIKAVNEFNGLALNPEIEARRYEELLSYAQLT